MKNNKALGIVLWLIGLLAAHLILFVIPDGYTAGIWVTYGFTWFAFLLQLILWLWVWRKSLSTPEQFLHTPALTISVVYLLLQLVCDLILVLVGASGMAAILVNALLAIVMGILLTLVLIAKNTIQRVDSRQKNHHREL